MLFKKHSDSVTIENLCFKTAETYFDHVNCISANNDAEAEQNQIRLNTLEDENNPVRAVFAVQKLNEGWDVLNLLDIVRLYREETATQISPVRQQFRSLSQVFSF